MSSFKFNEARNDFVIHGMSKSHNYNSTKLLKTDVHEIIESFREYISISILIWKGVYTQKRGKQVLEASHNTSTL